MVLKIQRIVIRATQLFRRKVGSVTVPMHEFEELKDMVNTVTASDVNVNEGFLQRIGVTKQLGKSDAPVIYLQIYQDDDVNICIFILKSGVKIPLHDHPAMHGLLKVLYGKVRVQSFSMEESGNKFREGSRKPCVQRAIQQPTVSVDSSDSACLLLPGVNNVHEISSVDGPAAFLDILSPPYGYDRDGTERDCHYYQPISLNLDSANDNSSSAYLLRVPRPNEFWCDQAEYEGPPVNGVLEE